MAGTNWPYFKHYPSVMERFHPQDLLGVPVASEGHNREINSLPYTSAWPKRPGAIKIHIFNIAESAEILKDEVS